jgi:hypothetical protein
LLDPGEINDLADTEAEKLRELVEFWHQYEAETGTVLKGAGDGPGREKFFGVKWDDWDGPKSVENNMLSWAFICMRANSPTNVYNASIASRVSIRALR